MKNLTKFFACAILFATLLQSCGSADTNTSSNADGQVSAEASVQNDTHYKTADLVDLDLSANGIPVVIKAPKGSKVLKYDVDGSISVYGGKFFKVNFKQIDGALADNMSMYKSMKTDKEMNPSFEKLETEEANGFMAKNTSGYLSFIYGLEAGGKSVVITEGMPYDISPDQFTDYPNDDIKLMWEAAKSAKVK